MARGLCGLGVVDDAKGNNLPGKEGDPLVSGLSFLLIVIVLYDAVIPSPDFRGCS